MNPTGTMKLEDVMTDLCSRFILNCPAEEFESVERMFFQIEEAHWFYDDFYREKYKYLPPLNMRAFAEKLFEFCPILKPFYNSIHLLLECYNHYKTRVPVCGAIILNPAMDKALFVKAWNSRSSWGFPKGKMCDNETHSQCAAREVYEEIGFDISSMITERDFIEVVVMEKTTRLYIVKGIPEQTHFHTRTRKEISEIAWHKIAEIGDHQKNRYWTVMPFLKQLKRWIARQQTSASKSTVKLIDTNNNVNVNNQYQGKPVTDANINAQQRKRRMSKSPNSSPVSSPAASPNTTSTRKNNNRHVANNSTTTTTTQPSTTAVPTNNTTSSARNPRKLSKKNYLISQPQPQSQPQVVQSQPQQKAPLRQPNFNAAEAAVTSLLTLPVLSSVPASNSFLSFSFNKEAIFEAVDSTLCA